MVNKLVKILIKALILAAIAVFLVDLLGHIFFVDKLETADYFLAKFSLYFIFSIIFLAFFKLRFLTIAIGGVIVASLFGIYYNVLPPILNYVPFGIPLDELSFLGFDSLFINGILFGTLHVLAFITGAFTIKLWNTIFEK